MIAFSLRTRAKHAAQTALSREQRQRADVQITLGAFCVAQGAIAKNLEQAQDAQANDDAAIKKDGKY